jgi:hypothetical protein
MSIERLARSSAFFTGVVQDRRYRRHSEAIFAMSRLKIPPYDSGVDAYRFVIDQRKASAMRAGEGHAVASGIPGICSQMRVTYPLRGSLNRERLGRRNRRAK